MYMVKDKTKTLSLSRKHLTQRVSELLWWWEKNSEESLRGRCCGGGDGRRRWSWIYLWGWVCNRCCVLTFPAIPNQVITAAPPALFSTMTTGVCTRVFERLFVTLLNSVHGWGTQGLKWDLTQPSPIEHWCLVLLLSRNKNTTTDHSEVFILFKGKKKNNATKNLNSVSDKTLSSATAGKSRHHLQQQCFCKHFFLVLLLYRKNAYWITLKADSGLTCLFFTTQSPKIYPLKSWIHFIIKTDTLP